MLGSIPKLFKNLYSSAQRTRQEVALKPLSRKPLVISYIPAVTLMRWIFFRTHIKVFYVTDKIEIISFCFSFALLHVV